MNKNARINLYMEEIKYTERNSFLSEKNLIDTIEHYSNLVLEEKDAFMSYAFARDVEIYCYNNEKRTKAAKFDEHEKVVIRSNDDGLMYLFATEVSHAHPKNILHAMPNGLLRKKLERELRPLNEYNL